MRTSSGLNMALFPSHNGTKKAFENLGCSIDNECTEHGCALVGLRGGWISISFVEGGRPLEECCDCIVARITSSAAKVIAVELKSGHYTLEKAKRQLEGGLAFFWREGLQGKAPDSVRA